MGDDAIEQSRCRERTEEEHRAVTMSILTRALRGAGVGEVILPYGQRPTEVSSKQGSTS